MSKASEALSLGGAGVQGENAAGERLPFKMRAPCPGCGSPEGYILERGYQDVVRCLRCNRHCYNAPRTETGKAVRSAKTVHAAITVKQRARIIIRASCSCETCGKRVTDTNTELHVGHVVSVKRGLEMGLSDAEINDDENLLALCSECNLGIGSEPIPMRLLVNVLIARLRRTGQFPTQNGATSGPTSSSQSKDAT